MNLDVLSISRTLGLALSLVLGLVASTHATVTAFDSFNYSPPGSDVAGNSGGGSFGFAGPWIGDISYDLAAGSLTSPVPLASVSANRVIAASFGGNRDLDRVLSQSLGGDNTTAYFSFLMQAEGVVGDGAFDGWFGFIMRAGLRTIHVGKDSFHSVYEIDSNAGDTALSTVPVVANQTHLLVLRADFLPGNDVYRLYIDPATGEPEPGTANATLSSFDIGTVTTVGISGPGAFGFDELRVGATWSDVTPVPEPGSLILAMLAASTALFFFKPSRSGRWPDKGCEESPFNR